MPTTVALRVPPNGQYVCLGYFATREEAAREYDRAALRQYGPDTYLNRV